MSPKVIVLGIDGLEYNLVEKWSLKNLMQKNYCKLDLSDYSVIVTPPIWGSMITGVVDEEVMKIWEKSAKILGMPGKLKQKKWAEIGFKIFDLIPPSIQRWAKYKVIDNIVGGENPFDLTANYVNDKNLKNVFQFFKNPWTNGLPGYGKNIINSTKRKLFDKALSGDKIPFKNHMIECYKSDKSQLLSALNKQEFDFIFWYTTLLDNLGHIYMGNEVFLLDYYLEINKLAGKVASTYPDACIYVISDHGIKPISGGLGVHSKYAFFSSNTNESIKKPVDMYNLILKHANLKN